MWDVFNFFRSGQGSKNSIIFGWSDVNELLKHQFWRKSPTVPGKHIGNKHKTTNPFIILSFRCQLAKKCYTFAQTLSSIDQNFHIQNKQRIDVSCFFKMRKCCPVKKTVKHMYFTLINYIYYFNDFVPVCIYYHIDVSFYCQKLGANIID